MKLDMHIHTSYSYDSSITIKELIKECKAKDIVPCITDHNTTKAWSKIKGIEFIKGEEISTKQGHVIGLFIQETIIAKDANEAIDKIKEQDGIVYIPHPHDIFRKGVNSKELLKKADIIEVINAKCLEMFDKKAMKSAENLKKLKGAGSDAHTKKDIGNAYVVLEAELSKKSLLKALRKGKPILTKRTGILSRVKSLREKIISWTKTFF